MSWYGVIVVMYNGNVRYILNKKDVFSAFPVFPFRTKDEAKEMIEWCSQFDEVVDTSIVEYDTYNMKFVSLSKE